MRSGIPPVLVLGLLISTGGCVPFPGAGGALTGNTAPIGNVGDELRAEAIVARAAFPAALAFAGDGRVFYVEKNTGRVRVIVDDVLQGEPVATVPVNFAGERGLLGIALHPNFDRNQRLYVFYSRSDTGQATSDPRAILDHRVVYFVLDGNQASGSEVFVASVEARDTDVRIGGRILFDREDRLLVGAGDQTNAEGAQHPRARLGKVLRFTADGGIPADNPDPTSAIFASGFRNIGGLALDSETGGVLALDRRASGRDEINVVVGGDNYGWPAVDGLADTAAEMEFAADTEGYRDPIRELVGDDTQRAGLAFNPSGRYGPQFEGRVFYGAPQAGVVLASDLSDFRTAAGAPRVFLSGFNSRITDVAFTPAGTAYVACEDAIYRITPTR